MDIKQYPWLTRGAVEFMQDYLKGDMIALEYGAGSSTKWIADRVKKLYSIEHDDDWHDTVRNALKDYKNVKLIHHERPYYYINFKTFFNFILIDGRDRVKCFRHAIKYLKVGGVIMLDNSERKEYIQCFNMTKGWPQFTTEGPDYLGTFNYPDWKTTWWIRS